MAVNLLDSHFVVFFKYNKTIQTIPKQRMIVFEDDPTNVSVKFETRELQDDGKEEIVDTPNDGKVVFSGGAAACRRFVKNSLEKIDLKKDFNEVAEKLVSLAQEGFGKRGAGAKLKQIIESEKNDEINVKKSKNKSGESNKNVKKTMKTKQSIKIPQKSKQSNTDELQMKELKSFSDVVKPVKSDMVEITKTGEKIRITPSKEQREQFHTETPRKNVQLRESPRKRINIDTVGTEDVSLGVTKTEEKNRITQSKEQREKFHTETPRKNVQLRESQRKRINTGMGETEARTMIPALTPSKRRRKDNKGISPRKSPELRKSPRQRVRSLEVTPSKKTAKKINEKSTEEKTPGMLMDLSQAVSSGMETYFESQTCAPIPETSHDISLENNLNEQHCQQHDHGVHEYGFNTNNLTFCPEPGTSSGHGNTGSQCLSTIVGFFSALPTSEQNAILKFMQFTTKTLAESIGQQSTPYQDTVSVETALPLSFIPERKMPLIVDRENTEKFQDVLVNPSKLREAEMKAMTVVPPANYLLNKVADLLFSVDDYRAAKGVKNLNALKQEALKEYLHTKCLRLNIEEVTPVRYRDILQNKITNARKFGSGRGKLKKKKMVENKVSRSDHSKEKVSTSDNSDNSKELK